MRVALLSLLVFTGADSLNDGVVGCDCRRRLALPDVPEHLSMPAAEFSLVSTERVGPLSEVPSQKTARMRGTDLGVSFERDGKIVFLFGDSFPTDKNGACCGDGVALTTGRDPIEYVMNNGEFLRLETSGASLQGMEVPVEGVADGAETYVFFSDQWSDDTKRHDVLVLAKTQGLDFGNLATQFIEETWRFINVSIVESNGEYFIFGSGTYRKSAVYLARVPKGSLAEKAKWRYMRRNSDGTMSYVKDEAGASQVVPEQCVGELNVRYEPALGRYVMVYNCDQPRGVLLRTAPSPEGPWSQPIRVFDPGVHGYGKFMHVPVSALGFDDHLGEPDRLEEWAGEYGPYLVPSWTTVEANGDVSLFYALSSWNPYQAHIIRSTLHRN